MKMQFDDIVFVYGALRSGTTVFRLMLDAHPQIANPGEMDFLFDWLVEDPTASGGWRYDIDGLRNDRIFRASGLKIDTSLAGLRQLEDFFDQLAARDPGSVLSINIHRNADRLAKIMPDVRVLHMVRDPRDIARSSIVMGWAGTLYHGVGHWIRTETAWDAAFPDLSPDRVMTLSYEALFEDAEARLTETCGFFSVPYDPAMLNYHTTTTYTAPDPSLVQQWKHKCDPDEIALLESRASGLMVARGYALSRPVQKLSALQKTRLTAINKVSVWRRGMKTYGAKDYWAEKVSRRLGWTKSHHRVRRRMQAIETARLK